MPCQHGAGGVVVRKGCRAMEAFACETGADWRCRPTVFVSARRTRAATNGPSCAPSARVRWIAARILKAASRPFKRDSRHRWLTPTRRPSRRRPAEPDDQSETNSTRAGQSEDGPRQHIALADGKSAAMPCSHGECLFCVLFMPRQPTAPAERHLRFSQCAMPPPSAAGAEFLGGASAIIASAVISSAAIEPAS